MLSVWHQFIKDPKVWSVSSLSPYFLEYNIDSQEAGGKLSIIFFMFLNVS